VRPGFDPHTLLTFNVSLQTYDKIVSRLTFYEQALARIGTMPDVERAALVTSLPLEQGSDILFTIEGGAGSPPSSAALDADFRSISPEFFRIMRIPLLRGRIFSKFDDAATEPVAVINLAMAGMFWPNQDPIGQRIWVGKPMGPEWTEPSPRVIVGIVGDIHESSLAEAPEPTIYTPYAQRPVAEPYFVIRTRQAPLSALPEIRAAIHQVDRDIALAEIRTMEEVLSASVTDSRFLTILLGLFGALALFIAAIGVYGVISYSVSQRTHEIGVRMALGAERKEVLKLVVGQGLKLAVIGVVLGVVAALALTRFMASVLYGVKPTDALTFGAVSLVLLAVALSASYIPARRATRVDPMVALRYE